MSLGKVYAYALTATVPKVFPGGRYLRLITADAAVDIEFFDESGQPLGIFSGVMGGFAIHVDDFQEKIGTRVSTFGKVQLTSATNQTVEVVISRARVEYDRLTGTVTASIAGNATLDSLADVSVTATTTVLLAAADSNQKQLIVGNPATNSQTMRIGDSGAGAANGTPLPPGATLVLDTSAAVYAYNPGAAAESLTVTRVKT